VGPRADLDAVAKQITQRRVINYMSRLIYPRFPLDTRLGGPQSRSGRDGEANNSEVSDQLHVLANLPPIPFGYEAGWAPESI
jgi:hypothetical protein